MGIFYSIEAVSRLGNVLWQLTYRMFKAAPWDEQFQFCQF